MSLFGEKRDVKLAINAKVRPGTVWHVISAAWFEKWKAYVGFELQEDTRKPEEIAMFFPGPIDNSSLEAVDGELKTGLNEGEDYILLPQHESETLYKHYGGGPQFPRNAVTVGTGYITQVQISLYRVRIQAYLCDQQNPEPDKNVEGKYSVHNFDKASFVNDALEKIKKDGFQLFFNTTSRIWLKRHIDTDERNEKDSMDVEGGGGGAKGKSEEGNYNKKPRIRRLLTSDVTNVDGDWHLIPHIPPEMTVQEALGNDNFIEVLVEVVDNPKPKESQWPRYQHLHAWKSTLKPGDIVDGMDRYKKWYEALVMRVDPKNIYVHYRSWSSTYDEGIPIEDRFTRIAPLYTKTKNRNHWVVGNQVDMNAHDAEFPIWIKATITKIDEIHDQIEVTYSEEEKEKWVKYHLEARAAANKKTGGSSVAAAVTSPIPVDDDRKKSSLQQRNHDIAGAMHDGIDDEDEEDSGMGSGAAVAAGRGGRWSTRTFDRMDEDICYFNTHPLSDSKGGKTETVEKTYSSSSSSSNFYGNSSGGYGSQHITNRGSTFSANSNTETGGGYRPQNPLHREITTRSGAANTTVSSSWSDRFDFGEKHTRGTPPVNGAVGLQNIGNTCFMNSILQCLSNTKILTDFFTSDAYIDQINYDNVLGHKGKIALAYGKLIKEMWSGSFTRLVPRELKSTIGEFQPQFAGYDQQDSQELMGFVLDGLHEDMNRVQKKPAVSKIESNGRSDELIASESWRRCILRNDSHLYDHMFGLLKSHVTCTNCGRHSVTFDPYNSISLPIPIRNTKTVSVIVHLLPIGSQPIALSLEVEVTETMSAFKRILIDKLLEKKYLSVDDFKTPAPEPASSDMMNASDTEYEFVDPADVTNNAASAASTAAAGNGMPRPLSVTDGLKGMDVRDAAGSVNSMSNQTSRMGNSTPLSMMSGAGEGSIYYKIHLHIGTAMSHKNYSIASKNYVTSDSQGTAIASYVMRQEKFIVYQLDMPVPEIKNSYSSYSYYGNSRPVEKEEPSPYFAVDLINGYKQDVSYGSFHSSTYERFESLGHAARIACTRNKTTNRDIHIAAAKLSRRFIREDSPFAESSLEERPYELVFTNTYMSSVNGKVELNDEFFEPPSSNNSMVMLLWKNDTRMEHMDADQVNAMRIDESEHAAKPAAGSGSSYNYYSMDEEATNKDAKLNIYQCLDKFIEREQLAETETVYCSGCKQHLAPLKKMDIWAAPDVMILHLKRFQYVPGQYFVHREKISDMIDFPVEGLDLSRYIIGPKGGVAEGNNAIYDLYAVSHHSGGMGGGHYTATCQNPINHQWYLFNDSNVSECDASRSLSSTAYVLFYKRRNGSVRWGGIVPTAKEVPDE